MNVKFAIKKRLDRKGRKCVAPFINEWNVWDIPEKQWTPEIQDAVARAFYIGARLMREHIQNLHPTIPEFPEWKEDK